MSKPFTPETLRAAGKSAGLMVAVLAVAAAAMIAFGGASHGRHTSAAAQQVSAVTAPTSAPNAEQRNRVRAAMGALPLAFEANQGQSDPQVKYMARGNGYTLFLTADEAVLSLVSSSSSSAVSRPKQIVEHRTVGYSLKTRKAVRPPRSRAAQATPNSVAALRMRVTGRNPASHLEGSDLLASKSNYFIGSDPRKWHKGVSQYARVSNRDVYPGITLAYHGRGRELEFDFVVAPGANPAPIGLSFSGASRMTTDVSGDLVLDSSVGSLTLHKPVAYQEQNGTRQPVDASFVLKANQVSFRLGNYDRNRELVIDPSVSLAYATYLGGNGDDEGYGVAVDSGGNSYVTGESNSTSGFPGGDPSSGGYDAFVVKINANGTAGYTTFVGGSGDDLGAAIAVDASDAVYVAGITTSTNFPVSAGAPQATSGGGGTCITGNGSGTCTDGFIFKLDNTGVSTYSTYLGGVNDDGAFGIAVDGSGNAYATGFTFSSNFPLKNAKYGVLNNNVLSSPPYEDAFVTEINAAGTAWVYSTYLGGQNNDYGNGVAVDAAGNAFVVGATSSIDFPVTAGAYQKTCGTDANCNAGGGLIFSDVFVSEIPAGGGQTTGPVYSTYLGGSSDDFGLAIALDSGGDAYVTGQTTDDNTTVSTGDFPVSGAFQQNYGGGAGHANAGGNAFVTKLNSTGSALVYSSYLGGSTSDVGFGIALDASDNAYLTGSTLSADFPVSNAFQTKLSGTSDAFATEVAANGGSLAYSTYLGGTGDENYDATNSTFIGGAVALDSSGDAHLAGTTSSSGFPITPGTVVQSSYGGNPFDAFAAIVLSATAPDFTISATTPTAVSPGTSGSSTVTLTSLNSYSQSVTLSCAVTGTGSPAPSCSASSAFSKNPVTPTDTSTLTITTTGAAAALNRRSNIVYAMWLPIIGLSLVGMSFSSKDSRKKKLLGFLLLGVVMAMLFFLPACGGGSGGGGGGGGGGCSGCTPAGNYTVTITGTQGNLSHSTSVTLTVN